MCFIFLGLPFLQHFSLKLASHALTHLQLSSGSPVRHQGCDFNQSINLLKLTFGGGWRLMLCQICSQIYLFLFKYICWWKGEGRTGTAAGTPLKLVWNAQECSVSNSEEDRRPYQTGWIHRLPVLIKKSKQKHRTAHRHKINVFWLHQKLGL